MYYEPMTITNCGHKGCAACLQPFRDCPLCGIDIAGRQPDPELAGDHL